MADLKGWTGNILRVNLSAGSVVKEPLNEEWARQYVGGRGVAARYLSEEVDPEVDPLAPENSLIFATGPLTGTNASCGSRYMVVTKGPLTGAMTTSNSGGMWAPELKFAGYDMIIFEGKSERPVYLWILDDEVELRPAEHLWGKGVFDTEDLLKRETGVPDCRVAAIGPAGENQVLFAAIVNEKFRAAGRSGVGAVMGSKNLKAIAVRGTGAVEVDDPVAMMRAQWAMKQDLTEAPLTSEGLPAYGTLALMNVINEHGALPTNNYQLAQFENAEKISGEELAETRLATNKACFACTIACGRVSRISDEGVGRYAVTTSARNWKHATEGPEYENAWSLGADCGIDDFDAILKSNTLCNDYGMDPISLGATIAAAMELYEKGTISEEQTGLPLGFGNADALVALTEQTAFRRGFGDEIAEGSKRMGEKFGDPDVFMGVKGQEFPAYDPRAIQGMGLGYATSNRGACHLRAYTVSAEIVGIPEPVDPRATEGKAELAIAFQNISTAVDATGLCIFLTFGTSIESIRPILTAATGAAMSDADLVTAGERIWNLERLWNNRAGLTSADDTLPKRMLNEPIPAGPAQGEVNKLGEMLPEYYRARGWSEDGRPLDAKLAELGII
ncbi:MAG: aldehyde ferredoxin oxidoreductase family protein [Myxococcales bacterium]|nr:aldehyde ferredoxin oxidoreductase family protein [Myxococcales bacterium]